MGYESNWANTSDVVRQHYNEREVDEKFGGQVTTSGKTKEVSWRFTYDDLPVNGNGKMEALIPGGAYIKAAYIKVISAMTGSSGTLTVGLEEPDGSTIDVDGIDVAVTQATLVADAWVDCNGAKVGKTIGPEAGQLLVTTGGTVTGGEFEVIIEYID